MILPFACYSFESKIFTNISAMKNIKTLQDLTPHIEMLHASGQCIVQCHGVFDLLHIGHIRYLRQAKAHGDILVVTITSDRHVDKGPGRPAFNEQLRREAVAALDCVDIAVISDFPTAVESMRLIKPTIYAKGAEFRNMDDMTGKIMVESKVAEELGAELLFVEDIVFSSSHLINRHLSTLSQEHQEYMQNFRSRHSLSKVLSHLDSLAALKVLVIGDFILDEYEYCVPLGASSKDPVLAVLRQSGELFAGGAAAVANHVAQYAGSVSLLTIFGEDGQENFARKALSPSVTLYPVIRKGTPTLRKKRIVDSSSFQKLIETYEMDTTPLQADVEQAMLKHISYLVARHDIILAADFGNGCITIPMAQALCDEKCFLAVNTQANAGNRGYHTISRYARADFVSLARHELALEYRNTNLASVDMMLDLRQRLNCSYVVLTEGRMGCAVLGPDDFQRAPSFASKVVDAVGAGDALFSLASLAAYSRCPSDVISFLGNIAGSLAVESIGNAKVITKAAMQKFITALMK